MCEVMISNELKDISTDIALGCIFCDVDIISDKKILRSELESSAQKAIKDIAGRPIGNLSRIKETRQFYKDIGKDPSRYRGSAEALLKRIVSNRGLYYINNVVDINNLISIKSWFCVGSYDLERISSPIIFGIGESGQSYKGIGKNDVNLENLPVFIDSEGPFGSPTSDSERAMITPDTKRLLMIIISFSGREGLEQAQSDAVRYLDDYANAKNRRCTLIEG